MSTVVEKMPDGRQVGRPGQDWSKNSGCLAPEARSEMVQPLNGLGGDMCVSTGMGDAVMVVARDERILWWNRSHSQMFGPVKENERISDWAKRHEFCCRGEGEGGEGSEFPYLSCRDNGERVVRDLTCRSWRTHDLRWLRVVCSPVFTAEHGPAVSVVLRDLTDLRNLKSLVSRLQAVEASNPSPALQITGEGTIRQANAAAQDLLANTTDPQSILSLLPELLPGEIRACIEQGDEVSFEVECGGRDYEFCLKGMPHLQRASVYGYEITAFRVAERRLRAEKSKAEVATRMKSEFLANMSHEIRTPMNGILGMASFLMDSDLDSQQKEFAETIHSSGESLLAIINDILDFSKLEAERLHLENVDFELSRVVGDTMDLLARQGQSKGLEILADIDSNVPKRLVGDPVRLRQILNNLLGNAIKFTESGDVELRIVCRGTASSGVELEFCVSDSGIGISTDKIEKLFRPFSQAESSTTRKYGGTGLGLVISKNLVELMDGSMKVESTLGVGSQFSFTARFGCTPLSKENKEKAVGFVGKRILIVDDHEGSARVLCKLLTHFGIECTRAAALSDAHSVLSAATLEGEPFHAVFVDGRLLGTDGLDSLGGISELARDSGLQVVILAGVDQFRSIKTQENAFSGLLSKPVRESKLLDCLEHLLGKEQVEAAKRVDGALEHSRSDGDRSRLDPSLKVLLVEDNQVNVKVTMEQLRRLGVAADCAFNGADALKMIEKRAYDVVLMDCQMPVLDGFRATSEIRMREREKRVEAKDQLPIIAMTANAMDGDRERCLASGMTDYLSKPVASDRLLKMLERVCPARTASNGIEADKPGVSSNDFGAFEQLESEVGSELALEILDSFVADSHVALEELRGAVANHDAKSVLKLAHSLKGTSATCGGRSLVYTCLQVESLAKEGEFSEIEGLIDELSDELEATLALVDEYRERVRKESLTSQVA